MHTVTMNVNGMHYAVNFNSDWSGDAIIFFPDGPNATVRQMSIPAVVFIHVAKTINDRALDRILDDLS